MKKVLLLVSTLSLCVGCAFSMEKKFIDEKTQKSETQQPTLATQYGIATYTLHDGTNWIIINSDFLKEENYEKGMELLIKIKGKVRVDCFCKRLAHNVELERKTYLKETEKKSEEEINRRISLLHLTFNLQEIKNLFEAIEQIESFALWGLDSETFVHMCSPDYHNGAVYIIQCDQSQPLCKLRSDIEKLLSTKYNIDLENNLITSNLSSNKRLFFFPSDNPKAWGNPSAKDWIQHAKARLLTNPDFYLHVKEYCIKYFAPEVMESIEESSWCSLF